VGEATDEGSIVPQCNAGTLGRYRALGRVCGLALVNECTLGLPFARYFLRCVLGEAPTTVEELQEELRHEDDSWLGRPEFLEQPLQQQGVDNILTMTRTTSASGNGKVPLAANPELGVTDLNKRLYLLRTLEHQLVLTIEQQAKAFREGVEDVTGTGCLGLLSAQVRWPDS